MYPYRLIGGKRQVWDYAHCHKPTDQETKFHFCRFTLKQEKQKKSLIFVTNFNALSIEYARGTQRQFSENICSEDDLRSRIFGTSVVKFLLVCLS